MTGDTHSTLARAADVTLDCHVAEEACPLNLAPTASTTATLALGDALAMALLARGFTPEDFARLHPGGQLGKRLLRVERLMHAGDRLPAVRLSTPMRDAIYEMSRKGLGMTCVTSTPTVLAGVITDGDLRRHMGARPDVLTAPAADVMTPHPMTISPQLLAVEALKLMEERKITSLIVCDDTAVPSGCCTCTISGARRCSEMSFDARAQRLALLLFDVDGVLTDGTVLLHGDGTESKQFHIRDGTAIVLAHRVGLLTGVLSARHSATTVQRATQLGMRVIVQGVHDKRVEFDRICAELGITADQVAYMGDDLLDLPVLMRAGISAAPADAVADVQARVDFVARAAGGRGAVREFVEHLLRARGEWQDMVDGFVAGAH